MTIAGLEPSILECKASVLPFELHNSHQISDVVIVSYFVLKKFMARRTYLRDCPLTSSVHRVLIDIPPQNCATN